jgi:hypothetical protein
VSVNPLSQYSRGAVGENGTVRERTMVVHISADNDRVIRGIAVAVVTGI